MEKPRMKINELFNVWISFNKYTFKHVLDSSKSLFLSLQWTLAELKSNEMSYEHEKWLLFLFSKIYKYSKWSKV